MAKNPARNPSPRRSCPNTWCTQAPAPYQLRDLKESLEEIAPLHLAENWDAVGLLSGILESGVRKVLLAIDLTAAVRDEAINQGADLLVVYHPPVFKPVKSWAAQGVDPVSITGELTAYGIWTYCLHTALDTAQQGTNDVLAARLGATVLGSLGLRPCKGQYLKLVTFVPAESLEKVAQALFAAGAGEIGTHYHSCSFRVPGTGTFHGDETTHPAVGEKNHFEQVEEIRFETILPAARVDAVVEALWQAHPYEEPAFDLLPLATPPERVGLGRIAELPHAMSLTELGEHCREALELPFAQLVGQTAKPIRQIALVAGSSGKIPLESSVQGFQAVITGELKHHDMIAYEAAGLGAVCLGHSQTERPVLAPLARRLSLACPGLEVLVSAADVPPFRVL